MEHIVQLQFIDLTILNTITLFLIGFIGGMVNGFIGFGGAFVLTLAMMSMGVPAVVAVASNMTHKFPKALVGAYKRYKYGQVDLKLGMVMGIFAIIGVLYGKYLMLSIKETFGMVGTDLYVSLVFIVILGIVGGLILRDGLQEQGVVSKPQANPDEHSDLIRWIRQLNIPPMMYFSSMNASVSLWVLAPLGFAIGVLVATVAVGGFIGVPAIIYVLGVPAIAASATELVIAFIMGLSGSLLYALEGYVDIRIAMIILAGSFFGVQIGAIGNTYVKDHVVKLSMAIIMLMVLASRLFYMPGYFTDLELIAINSDTRQILDLIGHIILALALIVGTGIIFNAMYWGMRDSPNTDQSILDTEETITPNEDSNAVQLSPLGRFEKFLVASDGSEFSAAAVREAINVARCCNAELHIMSLVSVGTEYEALGTNIVKQEMDKAQAHLDTVKTEAIAAGISVCQTHLVQGKSIHQEIVALADELKVDVIVMGRRGRRGMSRMMLGHATAMVIGQAHCNILVVPRASKIKGKHILIATDGSRFAESASITTTKLATICNSPVTVVSVTNPSHSEERRTEAWHTVNRVARYMHDRGVQVDTRTLQGKPAIVITELARERNTDIIITGSHGRTGLDRVLIGSTSERILNETPCAVLVVKTA